MSEAPDIHVCEVGPRDGLQNLGKGRSAIRRHRCGHIARAQAILSAHIPAKHLTTHRHQARIPNALRGFA
jgi:hypothetical protein